MKDKGKAMSNSIQRDLKKRKSYLKNELKRVLYKSCIQNVALSKKLRYHLSTEFQKVSRNSSRVRIQNHCISTGRNRAILRFCRLSRIKFRELASQGLLMGIYKSSW